jgi:hypothetical protein
LNLSIGTSNFKKFEPRFFLGNCFWIYTKILIFSNIFQFFLSPLCENSSKKKMLLQNFVIWNESIFIFFVGVTIVVFVMDQYELSLLVVGFILLIQALQELFVMPQSSSQLLFSMFESLYRNHQFNFQILLTSITLYNYRMSCCLLGLGDELGHWVKPWWATWFNHFLLMEYEIVGGLNIFKCPKIHLWTFVIKWGLWFQSMILGIER